LRAEAHRPKLKLQRLVEAKLPDQAEALLERLQPLGDEEWRKMLAGAPSMTNH
jgi:hypothetical protein